VSGAALAGAPALAWLAAVLAQATPAVPQFTSKSLRLPGPVSGIATVDLDGDGRRELLVGDAHGLQVRDFEDGAKESFRARQGAARTLAWCVVEHPGAKDELWLVDDEGSVKRVETGAQGSEAREVLKAGRLVLPSGVFSFPFARDLDGDGASDLALPVPSGLKLWFGRPDGTFAVGASVRHRIEVDLGFPAPGQGHPDVNVDVTVPSFQVADQNGDGHPDLAFESNDRLQFFWSDAKGRLPETPTFEIDLDEIRQKLGGDDEGLLDTSNLFKLLKTQVNATVRDLDGDGCADLLLRQGPKIALYGGTKGGIDGGGVDRSKALQVLKTSGNLIATFVVDDDGDGKLDLCMLQAADVSLGEVLLWVVAGGKLELDLYTYFQEERLRFARSPSRKRRLVIDIPNLFTITNELEKNPQLKELGDQLSRQPVPFDADGDGQATDLALVTRDGRIEIYPGAVDAATAKALRSADAALAADDATAWHDVIDRYDREAKGKDGVTIPLLGILDWVPMPGGKLRARIAGRTPALVLGTVDPATQTRKRDDETAPTRRFLVVQDLDGDRRDDLLLVDPDLADGAVELTRFVTPAR
jgi:hypothetical protein